jgi:hypothetical protein
MNHQHYIARTHKLNCNQFRYFEVAELNHKLCPIKLELLVVSNSHLSYSSHAIDWGKATGFGVF